MPQGLFRMIKFLRREEGYSVLEVLLGVALLVLGISAAMVLVSGGSSALLARKQSFNARVLAEEGVEAAEGIIISDWEAVSDGVYGLADLGGGMWSFSGTENVYGDLIRRVQVSSTVGDEKAVKSSVFRLTDGEERLLVALDTLVSNWREGLDTGGDTGGGGTTGDWSNPITLGSIDLGAGNSATGLDVVNKIVYLSTVASASSKPDFLIVDATDGSNLDVAASLNTGEGLNAVDVAGTYAYAAHDDDANQLQVIDVSDINSPWLVTSFTLSGNDEVARSIRYGSSRVYIGTDEDDDGPEFYVVDVTTPGTPSFLGSFEVGGQVNEIRIDGSYAYVAVQAASSDLRILDVSDPAVISLAGSYDAPGSLDDLSLHLGGGDRLYLGRGSGNSGDVRVLDVSNAPTVVELGSWGISGQVNGVVVRDSLAFVASDDSNEEFQVWDISDLADITLWSTFNFPQRATDIDYEDNLVYVSVRSNDALRIITSQ
jgi:hypothetical protein